MATPYLDHVSSGKTKDRFLRFFSRRYADRARFHALSDVEKTVLPHVVMTKDNAYAFVKNSKAGCTSVAHLLWIHDHGRVYDGNIHQAPFRSAPRHQALLKVHDSMQGAFRFSVVRNPTRRAVSGLFNFFIERKNSQSYLHWDAITDRGFLQKDDHAYRFDVFLDYVEASHSICPIRTDRHFRAQHINIGHDVCNLNYIARLESLQKDLDIIGEMAGSPIPPLDRLPDSRRNQSGSSAFTPSPAQVSRLEELYARDYELFGY